MVWANHVAVPTATATTTEVVDDELDRDRDPGPLQGERGGELGRTNSTLPIERPVARARSTASANTSPAGLQRVSLQETQRRAIASIVDTRSGSAPLEPPGRAFRQAQHRESAQPVELAIHPPRLRPRRVEHDRRVGGGSERPCGARPRDTATTRRRAGASALARESRRARRSRCSSARGSRASPSSTTVSLEVMAHDHDARPRREHRHLGTQADAPWSRQRGQRITAALGDSTGSRRSGRRTCRRRA